MSERFPDDVIEILKRPMPQEALKSAPKGLTSIKSVYISERLSEAFGLGRWQLHDSVVQNVEPYDYVDKDGKDKTAPAMVVVKAKLTLLDYPWFEAWAYGGNDNADLGDAYKGAVSDALSKIGATYLNIALEVFKGQATNDPPPPPPKQTKQTLKEEPKKEEPKAQSRDEKVITTAERDTFFKACYAEGATNEQIAERVKGLTGKVSTKLLTFGEANKVYKSFEKLSSEASAVADQLGEETIP